MPTNVDDIIRKLPAARRKKIEARAKELIAEEMTRQQLRRALERTQVDVARQLGITQDSVSRLEQRADILLSTLRKYIEALGGELSLVAEFPNHAPVKLSGIADDEPQPTPPKGRKRAKAYA
jgi:transcriptional regulator with XRE-family HTH domain